MPLRTVVVTRYVTPLREGGSVPAIVEADDDGMYVLKFRGAGQGPKALVAEIIAGEIGRAAGLPVPEIVLIELDPDLARTEPDPELSKPLEESAGLNLGLDFLPGSIAFDPVVGPAPTAGLASHIVLFDAFVTNVDRTPRNPNLLSWHSRLWLIDHGACLYFHHGWSAATALEGHLDPFSEVRHHVLLPWATKLDEALEHLQAVLTEPVIERVVRELPADWLGADHEFPDEDSRRRAYLAWLSARMTAMTHVLEEAKRGRAQLL